SASMSDGLMSEIEGISNGKGFASPLSRNGLAAARPEPVDGRAAARTSKRDEIMSASAKDARQRLEPIRCPYDGHVVGEMPVADEAAVEQAVQDAVRAFQVMRRLPRFARADILERTADLLEARRDELVRLIAAEAGKPLYDARGEVARSLFNLRNAAREARAFAGHEVPLDVDAGVFEYQTATPSGARLNLQETDIETLARLGRRFGIARRFPIGPVLAITPFNFPLNLV